MPLAALIIAGDAGPGPSVLGQSLIEFQLRRARAAGAAHAVLVVERMPPALIAGIDRLRREGLTIDVVRDAAGAAESIHPDERVLLIAPEVIIDPERMGELAQAPSPSLLTVGETPANHRYELVDGATRWTGHALIDGALVRKTAAMVGDWDLGSTLLRKAVQAGAGRIALSDAEAVDEIAAIDAQSDAQAIGRAAMRGGGQGSGLGRRFLIVPPARLLAGVTAEAGVQAGWLAAGGTSLTLLAAMAALTGWITIAPVLFLGGLIAADAGGVLAGAGGRPIEAAQVQRQARAGAAVVGALAFASVVWGRTGQWGCGVLGALLVGATGLATLRVRQDRAARRRLGDAASHALLLGIGAALGMPVAALALTALHAAGGLAWLDLRAAR